MQDWLGDVAGRFGLAAGLERLGGEYDLNFRAHGAAGPAILKVMHAGCDPDDVAMQIAAIRHAGAADPDLPLPALLGEAVTTTDDTGAARIAWAMAALPGTALAEAPRQPLPLLRELGQLAGRLSHALRDFDHPRLARAHKWRLPEGGWIADHLSILPEGRRELVAGILAEFEALRPALIAQPAQAIHNDLNDWNVLIRQGLAEPSSITGLIDFGDMSRAPVICDLAILAAYALLDRDDPERALAELAAGYHAACPLPEDALPMLWPLVRMRLAVSVVNAAIEAAKRPNDAYAVISQEPAWRLLERGGFDPTRILARLRHACGLPVVAQADAIRDWLDQNRGRFAPITADDLADYPEGALSVADAIMPENPFHLTAAEARTLDRPEGARWMGRAWGEPRLVYTDKAFFGPTKSANRRTVHLGADIFAPAGTALHAPLDGVVARAGYEDLPLGYGGNIVLRHDTPAGTFFTLWGHLSRDAADLAPGTEIKAGTAFARMGGPEENGGWAPHLHFQLGLEDDPDWDGVADPDDRELQLARYPNPAALLNLPDDRLAFRPAPEADLLAYRHAHFAPNLKLSYREPVMLLRGWRHHLFDQWGRPWLDAYNNVPHVGHAHPRIRAVANNQLGRMNSNTRYLHPAPLAFAEKIISKMPPGLDVCFFVNSGSEANELALRLARHATGGLDMITPDHGYHGNTTGAIDLSAYKFNRPGMRGRVPWVHLVDVADDYRGRFRAEEQGHAAAYAAQIDGALAEIKAREGGKLAGFICEVFPSVGGQIIPPTGYLADVYARIRAAGGICIADEVQTGLGRLGEHYFAFEHQGVVPDVVVLGKPIGNGHPLGVVVTTQEIARRFAEGPEFFSTFGGSNLSSLIGKEVLDIVDDEGLAQNAATVGAELLAGLRDLQDCHPSIGQVRGMGLFTGVDLVTDRETRAPGTLIADHVINRLRDMRILIGREGPADNVLKIRPPLTFDSEGVAVILDALDRALSEAELALAHG